MQQQPTKLSGCLDQIGIVYKSIAIIFLTTILFISGFEAVLGIYKHIRRATIANIYEGEGCSGFARCNSRQAALPYYQNQEWAEAFWDISKPGVSFHPYSMWHTETYKDDFYTFGDEGFRETPNVQCNEGAYHIFMFGGSTLWGEGSPDWGTIPAYMQEMFNNQTDQTICIHNMGQLAFHVTQEVVELTNQLQLGVRPDMVVFYDGVNEIGNAIESGKVWVPSGILPFRSRLEQGSGSPYAEIASSTNIYNIFSRYFISENNNIPITPYSDEEVDSLIQDTVDVYLNNYRIVEALSEHFDFKFYFFWQPTIGAGNKALTEDEQEILALDTPRSGPGYFNDPLGAVRQTYEAIEAISTEFDNLFFIGDTFDDYTEQIYIDIWHITPQGNEIIARELFNVLSPIIKQS